MKMLVPEAALHYFCVYGVAELLGENDSRVWPKQVLVRDGQEFADSWLVLEGVRIQGACVIGVIMNPATLEVAYGDISCEPSPIPPGEWGRVILEGGRAQWEKVIRRTAWELLLSDEG